jgi:magnesium-transporting ATPase (P-type)
MLGIEGDCSVYTGPQVDAMDDDQLEGKVLGCNVWARASPENKLRIVRALQVGEGGGRGDVFGVGGSGEGPSRQLPW